MTGALAAAFAPSALARDVTWPGVIGPHSRGAGWFQEGKGMPRQRWTWWVQGLAVCFSGRPRGELAHEDGRHASHQEVQAGVERAGGHLCSGVSRRRRLEALCTLVAGLEVFCLAA